MQTATVSSPKPKESGPAQSASDRLLKNWPLLLIAAFWLLSVLFVGLAGNFPLNDDWIYAEAVKHFLTSGQIRLLACAPACIFHIVFAAAVCKVFGFSYVVLRSVGFFWAVLASFSLYGCCRQLRLHRAPALLMTLCFSANPIFICLAFSFMTDTPAIALTLAYTYFLLRGLKAESREAAKHFLLASACLLAATCVRQNLAFLALTNCAVLGYMWLKRRHSWAMLLGLIAAPLACGFLADKWMLATCDFTSLYIWYKGMVAQQLLHLLHLPGRSLPGLIQIAGELLAYLGLFLLPVLVCFAPAFLRLFANKANINPSLPLIAATVTVFSMCRFVIGEKRLMPFSQNILRIPELGAHTILGINYPALSNRIRENLTWTSGLAGFALGTLLLDAAARTWMVLKRGIRVKAESSGADFRPGQLKRQGHALCAIAAISLFLLQFAFNTLQSTFSDIDRYYLFPLIGAIMVLSLSWRWHKTRLKPCAALALPLLLAMTAYSFCAAQDMMAWNRARWHAIDKLEASGLSYKSIDGGAEYNYARDPMLFKSLILHDTWYELTHRGEPPRNNWRWWSIAGEDYIISFSPVPGYETVSTETYWSALGGKREVLTLHHVPEPKSN